MKKNNDQVKRAVYKCEIYNPLPDKIIDEFYIRAYSQHEAKERVLKYKRNENILLITAQKIEIL